MIKGRTFARLPRTAYQPDLLDTVGSLQHYPTVLRKWVCHVEKTEYRLLIVKPGKYRIFKNKAIVNTLYNEYNALQMFKDLLKKHDNCVRTI